MRHRIARRAAWAAAAMLLFVLGFEATLRLAIGTPLTHWHTDASYGADGGTGPILNDQGLRSTYSDAGPKRRFSNTIIFVGDSFTFGENIPAQQDFPALVSRALPTTRVINLGASGMAPDYYRAAIAHYAGQYKDLSGVFIMLYDNDVDTGPASEIFRSVRGFLRFHTHSYYYLAAAKNHVKYEILPWLTGPGRGGASAGGPITPVFNAPGLFSYIDADEDHRAAFAREIMALLREVQAHPSRPATVFTVIPSPILVSPRFRDHALSTGATAPSRPGRPSPAYDIAREICGGHDSCRFLDIFEDLNGRDDLFFEQDIHWNQAGHAFMAETILRSRALLDKR